jgi:hypothetical protein
MQDLIIPDKLIDAGVKEDSRLDVTYNDPGGESVTYRSNLFLTH